MWSKTVDFDFPLDLLKLQIEVLTGTEFDPSTGELKLIEPERFEKLIAEYLEKAADHYKECQFKHANIFRRFFPGETQKNKIP